MNVLHHMNTRVMSHWEYSQCQLTSCCPFWLNMNEIDLDIRGKKIDSLRIFEVITVKLGNTQRNPNHQNIQVKQHNCKSQKKFSFHLPLFFPYLSAFLFGGICWFRYKYYIETVLPLDWCIRQFSFKLYIFIGILDINESLLFIFSDFHIIFNILVVRTLV